MLENTSINCDPIKFQIQLPSLIKINEDPKEKGKISFQA